MIGLAKLPTFDAAALLREIILHLALEGEPLARLVKIAASNPARLVDNLVQRGLLVREEDAEDRRARVLSLSAKGRAFIARAGESRVKTILGVGASLPKGVAARFFRVFVGQ